MHRRARRGRIARANGIENGGVIADRLARQLLRMKVTLQTTPQLGALIPQPFDDELQRTVPGRFGNAEVKLTVARLAHGEVLDVRLHALQALSQQIEIRLRGFRRGHACDLAFDQLSRLQQLEGSRPRIAGRLALGCGRSDENTGTDAHFDQAPDLEGDDCLAHGGAAYAKRARQVTLCRQPRARRELSAGDQLRDLSGDLPVEPAWLDGLQGHGGISSMTGGPA